MRPRSLLWVVFVLGLGFALGACAPGSPGGERAPAAVATEPPRWLEETGFVLDPATAEPRGDLMPFAPQYPLWTDGAAKRRWIWLPPGSAIDASDPDAWVFPVGTKLWKEFAQDGRRIETRCIERLADGSWRFATYVWDGDQRRAELAPARGLRSAYRSGGGVVHDVPGRSDCLSCHGNGATPVLGFSALQLSPDRDPLAPHAEEPPPGALDLPGLVRRGLLEQFPAAYLEAPPRIAAAGPRERAVLGYLHANCGGCHQGSGPLAGLGPRLDQGLAPRGSSSAPDSLTGRPGRYRPAQGEDPPLLVAPGDPDASLLVHRLGARGGALAMPPLGSAHVDEQALALVRAWISMDLAAPEGGPLGPRTQPLASSRP